jgi:hypothetical protein
MKRLFYIVVIIPLLFLTACGGGSSSGGGGAFSGTYKGTTNLMVAIPNQAPVPISFPTTIVISPDGTVTITGNLQGTVVGDTGTISGNKITARGAGNFSPVSGVTCSGSEIWNGTVTYNAVQATYSGSANCKSPNGTFPITITGKLNATRSLSRAPAVKMRNEQSPLLNVIVRRVIE